MGRLLVAALIRSAHGVRGECKITSTSGEAEHLKNLGSAILRYQGLEKHIVVEHVRGALPNLILKIKGLETPEQVNQLRGAQILVDAASASPLAANEYYAADLEGLALVFRGEVLGQIVSVWDSGAGSNLEVRKGDDTTVHIPFRNEFVGKVDLATKQVELLVDWILE